MAVDRSLAASFGRRVGGGEAGRHSGWEWGQGSDGGMGEPRRAGGSVPRVGAMRS